MGTNKKNQIINYLLMAFCLIAFLIVLRPVFRSEKISERSFEDLFAKTMENISMDPYPAQGTQSLRRYFELEPSDFEQIAFYRLDDAMSADELLLARFSTPEAARKFEQAVQARIQSQTDIYAGYAPEQEQTMKQAHIEVEGNYALYVSGAQAAQIAEQFEKAL